MSAARVFYRVALTTRGRTLYLTTDRRWSPWANRAAFYFGPVGRERAERRADLVGGYVEALTPDSIDPLVDFCKTRIAVETFRHRESMARLGL